ncbi:DUF7620 family protein [Mycolicibacterium llatzerense]|uniref:Uncharacterized protein n=1 Tax=Mycolicibacterium llatzerense TaxID=280871 RepID=A0A0D1J9R1_9MYCO|nr:hypothetical protein TL10_02490 [Mycolicibacterium llatzerense]
MILRRRKHEVAESQSRIQDAEARAAAAEEQVRASQVLAAQSRNITARLVHEVEKNGWTELLQHAWGAR